MTYDETLSYIHSIRWEFCKPGLERIRDLCSRLGNPQDKLKFVHVAGTNGKGSFCAMLSSILTKAGYRTGLFTSPYIKRFNERMMIAGVPIPDEELIEVTERVKPAAAAMDEPPTEFELITAIAFLWFAEKQCDIVVLEVGMGGRLDSTNIIEHPELSVITGIALDHTSFLGNTVAEIAAQKAGIIKPHCPALWCGDAPDADAVIRDAAQEKQAPLYAADLKKLHIRSMDLEHTEFDFRRYHALSISMLGTYQPRNAANVLTAVPILRKLGWRISPYAVRAGLKAVRWPARFEVLCHDPLLIYDGGHNPQGVDAAAESVHTYFGENKVLTVTGVMKDKDYGYVANRIAGFSAHVFTITPDNPRALSAEDYAAEYRARGVPAEAYPDLSSAMHAAILQAQETRLPLLCLGSLYFYESLSQILSGIISPPQTSSNK